MTQPQGDTAPENTDTGKADTKTGPQDTDKGFPAGTPVDDMTAEQQAAYWKYQARRHEDRSKSRGDYDELKAKATEFDRQAAARKTESQKLAERAEAAEKAAAEAQLKVLKRDIADEFGIPSVQADRLRGTTEAELRADAEEFAPFVKASKEPKKAPPSLDQGAGNGSPKPGTESGGRDLYATRHSTTTS